MMMHNPPPSSFLTIDVRDAMRKTKFVTSKRNVPVLDAQFVGHFPDDVNDLSAQFDVSR